MSFAKPKMQNRVHVVDIVLFTGTNAPHPLNKTGGMSVLIYDREKDCPSVREDIKNDITERETDKLDFLYKIGKVMEGKLECVEKVRVRRTYVKNDDRLHIAVRHWVPKTYNWSVND